MIRRQLFEELIEKLIPLVGNIIDDWELQMEVRDQSVTIYYRGAALLRGIRLENGHLVGSVHYKYIPLQRPENSGYVRVKCQADGFSMESSQLQPLSLLRNNESNYVDCISRNGPG